MKRKLFDIGDIVYLKVDEDIKGIVTGIIERQNGFQYMVSTGLGEEMEFNDFELITERSFGRGNDDEDSSTST